MVKITLVGNSFVGKTTLVDTFVGRTRQLAQPTIGAAFQSVIWRGEKLEIWDTAGQERYQALVPMYMRGAEYCILMWDVTDEKTRRDIDEVWEGFIRQFASPECKFIYVGNKIDMLDDHPNEDSHHDAFYISAKQNINVTSVFDHIVADYKSNPTAVATVPDTGVKNSLMIHLETLTRTPRQTCNCG